MSFNYFFSSVCTEESFTIPHTLNNRINIEPPKPIMFTASGIRQEYRQIHNPLLGKHKYVLNFFKLTCTHSSVLLCKLLKSLATSTLHNNWRFRKHRKLGSINDPSNYRPIPSASVACKIIEHVLYFQIMGHLSEHNLINPNQNGFRKRYSSQTQLFKFITGLHENFKSSHSTDAMFIDCQSIRCCPSYLPFVKALCALS